MQICFLGHAGFMVETSEALVIMDAWVSPNGAFDGGWFQLPKNHHMAEILQHKVSTTHKPVYIYISHEHKDHFDMTFLKTLVGNITYVIPNFRRTLLYNQLQTITSYNIVCLEDEMQFDIPNGFIKIYTDDSEMDRDSAILLYADGYSFLNLNDCKIFDRLANIKQAVKTIDVFSVQFSGATWHPTCYDYTEEIYATIAVKKKMTKFVTAAKAIKTIAPRYYIPSAGPACFLDPATLHINFERENIFPRTFSFLQYLYKNDIIAPDASKELMPGDMLDVNANKYALANSIDYETNFEKYIADYAADYKTYFEHRKPNFDETTLINIQNNLLKELQQKLNGFNSHKTIERNLFIAIHEIPNSFIMVDFTNKRTSIVPSISDENFYTLQSTAVEFYRIINGLQTWEDFSLTFRMKLNRAPDAYQSLIHGFLILEADDMEHLCKRFEAFEKNTARINITVNNTMYSINRYCPHQGADLTEATIEEDRFVVCPRHGWRFDIMNNGLCQTAQCSLEAKCYEPE